MYLACYWVASEHRLLLSCCQSQLPKTTYCWLNYVEHLAYEKIKNQGLNQSENDTCWLWKRIISIIIIVSVSLLGMGGGVQERSKFSNVCQWAQQKQQTKLNSNID